MISRRFAAKGYRIMGGMAAKDYRSMGVATKGYRIMGAAEDNKSHITSLGSSNHESTKLFCDCQVTISRRFFDGLPTVSCRFLDGF